MKGKVHSSIKERSTCMVPFTVVSSHTCVLLPTPWLNGCSVPIEWLHCPWRVVLCLDCAAYPSAARVMALPIVYKYFNHLWEYFDQQLHSTWLLRSYLALEWMRTSRHSCRFNPPSLWTFASVHHPQLWAPLPHLRVPPSALVTSFRKSLKKSALLGIKSRASGLS